MPSGSLDKTKKKRSKMYAISGIRKSNGELDISEMFSTNLPYISLKNLIFWVFEPDSKSLYKECVIVTIDE